MLEFVRKAAMQTAEAVLPGGMRDRLRRQVAAPTLVLLYHRVQPEPGRDPNKLIVTCEDFEDQMAWLARYARVVAEEEFFKLLAGRPLSSRPRVLITFDDGYADNVVHALPILQRYGLRATMFVTSGAVGSDRLFWWDGLERIVAAATENTAAAPLTLPDGTAVERTAGFESMYGELHGLLKTFEAARRRTALESLTEQVGADLKADESSRPVTPEQLRAWCEAGMSVGAHSRTHAQLSALSEAELQSEIWGSRQDLEQWIDSAVTMFAYPFGGRLDFDARAEEVVNRAGFRCAFMNWEGDVHWARRTTALPRCLVRNWGLEEFERHFQEWRG